MDVIDNSVLKLLYEHRYIFAFLGALFEGSFIMILSGALLKFGYVNFWGLAAVLISGYFLNGIGWYLLGRIGGNAIIEKLIKRFRVGRKIIGKLEGYFQKHSVKTIFWTRITYGFSMFGFMIAGSLKMNWKKFLVRKLVGGYRLGFGCRWSGIWLWRRFTIIEQGCQRHCRGVVYSDICFNISNLSFFCLLDAVFCQDTIC